MNANFGILPSFNEIIKDKAERKRRAAERSLKAAEEFKKEIGL